MNVSALVFTVVMSLLFATPLPVHATSLSGRFMAKAFVASYKPTTPDFKAGVVPLPGDPFCVVTSTVPAAKGTYAGVLLTPASAPVYANMRNISFQIKGSLSTNVTVHFAQAGQSSFKYSSIPASWCIKRNATTSDGYEQVTIQADQLGIGPENIVDRIVISPDTLKKSGSFLVKELHVNGLAVAKSVEGPAQFFNVVSGTGSGPLEQFAVPHVQAQAAQTSISLKNGLSTSQQFYCTLITCPTCINSVTQLNFQIKGTNQYITPTVVPLSANCQGGGVNTLGTFTLAAGQTIVYTPSQQLSINFYCPVLPSNPNYCNQCTSDGRYGATFAEATIGGTGFETTDISEVNGINAQFQISNPTSSTYACTWSSGNYLQPSTAPNPGQYIPINTIKNNPGQSPFLGDIGNPGVYPYGCDICVGRSQPGCSNLRNLPAGNTGCDTTPPLPADRYSPYRKIANVPPFNICQANRAPGCNGGTVAITLLQYPFPLTPLSR